MKSLFEFIGELHRRKMFKAAGGYIAVALVVLELASLLQPTLGFSQWVYDTLVLALMIGFPINVAVSWTYNFTVHGFIRTDNGKEDTASK